MSTPPTNKPKMPEVIYLNDHFALDTVTNKSELNSYTRTDKVQELKDNLTRSNQLLNQMLVLAEHNGKLCKDSILTDAIRIQVTKASNLLK